ncbi:hypothetical protein JI58_07925 [Marinosulfonomonas sp. PRT-SC04]|nr:hypothetical protein JI58_07925 [Marinosulfonomonas sp. PRT-SC04]
MRGQFLAVSGVAVTLAGALTALTISTSKTAAEIKTFAQVANAAPEELQKWAAASKSVGIEQEKLADILKDVNDRVGDFLTTGGGPMADFFENVAPKIGITADAFRDLSGPQALQLYTTSLEKAGLSQQEMTFYLEAMASDTTALIPLLRNGGAEMARLGENARTLGGIMSTSTIVSLTGLRAALNDTGMAVKGIGYRISGALAPALTSLAIGFNDSMREGGMLRGVIDGLVGNIDVIIASMNIAVVAFGVRYVGALIAAKVATFTFAGALTVLKRALVATGIGALIVGAGYLTAKFSGLVTAVGGFGTALVLLKEVGQEIFGRLGEFGTVLLLRIKSDAAGIKGSLIGALADVLEWVSGTWANKFIGTFVGVKDAVVAGFETLPTAFKRIGAQAINGLIEMVESGVKKLMIPLNAIRELAGMSAVKLDFSGARVVVPDAAGMGAAVSGAFSAAMNTDYTGGAVSGLRDMANEANATSKTLDTMADAGWAYLNRSSPAFEKMSAAMAEMGDAVGDANEETETFTKTLTGGKGGKGGKGGAAGALKETKTAAEGAAKAFAGRLSSAVGDVAGAFGDWVAGGFKNFKGMVDGIRDSFKKLLSDLISTAIANPIKIALGLSGSGGIAGSAASAATGGGAGGGGLLSGLFGKAIGGFGKGASLFGGGGLAAGFGSLGGGTGLLGGLGNTLAGTFGTGGGIGGLFSSIGGGAGIMSSIGAALPVIGIALAVFSFFKKKTKLLDSGIRGIIDMEAAMFESYKKIKTTRFWGLSKKIRTSYSKISEKDSAPFTQAVDLVKGSVLQAAESLGVSADVFDGFSHTFKLSLKGLDDAAKQVKIEEAMSGLGDALALRVLGSGDDVDGSYDALVRLSASLVTVNDAFRDLDFSLFNISLAGGEAAAKFAELFGSLENFTKSSVVYYDQFYTGKEKLANATARLTESLAGLGVNFVPDTNAAYRKLVDTAMATGDTELGAALIQLAPAFVNVTSAANTLSGALLASVTEAKFASGVDYRRALSRAGNNIGYTPERSQAEILVELRALNARLDLLQSTSEITAANTGSTANNTEDQVAIALETAL